MKPDDAWEQKRYGIIVDIPAENDRLGARHTLTVQELRDYKGETAGATIAVMASRLVMALAGNINPAWLMALGPDERITVQLTVEREK